jgi:hypothetical protein
MYFGYLRENNKQGNIVSENIMLKYMRLNDCYVVLHSLAVFKCRH